MGLIDAIGLRCVLRFASGICLSPAPLSRCQNVTLEASEDNHHWARIDISLSSPVRSFNLDLTVGAGTQCVVFYRFVHVSHFTQCNCGLNVTLVCNTRATQPSNLAWCVGVVHNVVPKLSSDLRCSHLHQCVSASISFAWASFTQHFRKLPVMK